ncbi:hypothetical protein C8Q76DRAFT_692784 [Earliella scabrosa]|nr:hypothetical protein C8Q76DRAFT_692784 [Earliella scabrosa]
MRLVPAHICSFLSHTALVSTALVNYTIDDEYGDSVTGLAPSYLPPNGWSQGSQCGKCIITPAVHLDQPFASTWHDATFEPGGEERRIQARFTGSAVYVFNLVPNNVPKAQVTYTNLTFFINNTLVGHYVHTPDPSGPQLQYRVPVYVNASLPYADHILDVVAGGTQYSLVLFDSITYTSNSEDDGAASNTQQDVQWLMSVRNSTGINPNAHDPER